MSRECFFGTGTAAWPGFPLEPRHVFSTCSLTDPSSIALSRAGLARSALPVSAGDRPPGIESRRMLPGPIAAVGRAIGYDRHRTAGYFDSLRCSERR
jgi:hypothetical protein